MLPYYTINAERVKDSRILLVCDHASSALPDGVEAGEFIADPADMEKHIGVDIGAADVTKYMAEILNCPAILANYSRLYLDVNRPEGDFTSMRAIADGAVIRGNCFLTDANKQERNDSIFHPYHNAVDSMREQMGDPAIIFVHSFTPIYKGEVRPWNVGILSDKDKRLSHSFLQCWGKHYKEFAIGDNLPYSGEAVYSYSIHRHGTSHGHLNFGLEIRQDLIGHQAGVVEWAKRASICLQKIVFA